MAPASRTLRSLHGVALLVLFAVGIVLVYQSSNWYLVQGSWLGTASLALVGGSSLCLALFGQKNKSEGVVAATIISVFWTVGAAIAFGKDGSVTEAWSLAVSAIAQVGSSILGAAIAKNGDEFEEEEYLGRAYSPNAALASRNYGALSTFIDPLSSAAATVRPGPSGSQASNISQASQSPAASPNIIARTPSPFAMHNSPHRLGPTTLASLSAAAATPKETPEDIKQSYKALWEKYDLDT